MFALNAPFQSKEKTRKQLEKAQSSKRGLIHDNLVFLSMANGCSFSAKGIWLSMFDVSLNALGVSSLPMHVLKNARFEVLCSRAFVI